LCLESPVNARRTLFFWIDRLDDSFFFPLFGWFNPYSTRQGHVFYIFGRDPLVRPIGFPKIVYPSSSKAELSWFLMMTWGRFARGELDPVAFSQQGRPHPIPKGRVFSISPLYAKARRTTFFFLVFGPPRRPILSDKAAIVSFILGPNRRVSASQRSGPFFTDSQDTTL